ncbi:helix-turn-helix transcriptional regulator [Methanobrevibacter sp.]|uniref:helix-turn-helix transcriptional regulator n=1 Tax=Methanobrevibacter sp. TaxID=66852 RepID=UPI00388E5F6B
MNFQNEINNDIKFLAQSEIRLKILSELNEHPDNIRGIVKRTEITYSSVSSNLSKLEHNNHIQKIDNKYYVNPITEIYYTALMDFKKSVELINNYNSFWAKHNIDQLSVESIKRLTDLKDSKIVETTIIDIYKTHNTTKHQLLESKSVKAIFPFLHPEHPEMIETILENDGTLELIIPHSIYKALLFNINTNVRKNAIKKRKLKIYPVDDDLNIYLTICDETMSLGLFKNDGSFDQNRILTSDSQKSHQWALDLFNTIKHDVIK